MSTESFDTGPVEDRHKAWREAEGEMPDPWGWAQYRHKLTNQVECVPTWDIHPHVLAGACPCEPELDEHGYLVHNSFDGREKHEILGAPLN